jgi:hypothetical protein
MRGSGAGAESMLLVGARGSALDVALLDPVGYWYGYEYQGEVG